MPSSSSASSWISAMTGLKLAVRKKQPSPQRLTHSSAEGFFSNSTMPSPLERPRSSTKTKQRSISPKILKDLWSNSLDTQGPRLLTLTAAWWGEKRTLRARPCFINPSNSRLTFSASKRVPIRTNAKFFSRLKNNSPTSPWAETSSFKCSSLKSLLKLPM